MDKMEYIRLIGLWAGVFAIVIFSYQLGMYNVHQTEQFIGNYCSSDIEYVTDFGGGVMLRHNITDVTKNVNFTVP